MTRGFRVSGGPRRTALLTALAVAVGGLALSGHPLSAQAPAFAGPPPAADTAEGPVPAFVGEVGESVAETPTGIWWGFGVGGGSLRFTCDLCARERDRGPTLYAAVGAYAAPGLRVGMEGGGWTRDDGAVREEMYRAGLTGFLHPDPESGFHVLAGLSWVGYRADDIRYDSGALSVGLGWEFEVVPGWAVGNAARIDAASFGSFQNDDDRVAEDVGLSLVRFEVTVRRR